LTDDLELKHKLFISLLDAHSNEYRHLLEVWRDLERKAQGVIAISGVFLAAAFAFVRQIDCGTQDIEKVLLCIAIVLLVTSVLISVLVLRIREVRIPPGGEFINNLVDDILKIDESSVSSERYSGFIFDQVRISHDVNEEMSNANESKAKHLWRAQLSVICAIGVVAITTIISILN